MPREKVYYRDNLEYLTTRFDGKFQVRISEVCRVLKMSPCSARARFSFDKNGWITLATLARDMCD